VWDSPMSRSADPVFAPAALCSDNWLFYLLQQYAPMTEVWQMGPGNLKQLIIEW